MISAKLQGPIYLVIVVDPDLVHHVSPSFLTVAIRFPVIQPYALFHKTYTEHRLCTIIEFANLVDIRVCWDIDRVIWGVERHTITSCPRWRCQDGGRSGQTCNSDDCQCEPGCNRGGYAEG